MTELICIVCPKGCHLKVEEENGYNVSGASCARGQEYGKIELTDPRRVVTSTVVINGAEHTRLPVKTDRAIAKKDVFKVMAEIDKASVIAPVIIGQIIIENPANSGANIVATRTM